MSKLLTVNETVELLDTLKKTVREFAAIEEKLNREYRSRKDLLERRLRDDVEALESRLTTSLADAEATFQSARERLQANHDARRARINRSLNASKRLGLQRLEGEEGRLKYPVQKGLLEVTRNRTDALARNDASLTGFQNKVAESRIAFEDLEFDAQRTLRGYGKFRRMLRKFDDLPNPDLSRDEHQLLEQLHRLQHSVADDLKRFRRMFLTQVFRFFPLSAWITLFGVLAGTGPAALKYFGGTDVPYVYSALAGAVAIIAVTVLHFRTGRSATPLATAIAKSLETARRLHAACQEKATAQHAQEIQRIETEAKNETQRLEQTWDTAQTAAAEARDLWPHRMEEKWRRVLQKAESLYEARLRELETDHTSKTGNLQTDAGTRRQQLTSSHQTKLAKLNADFESQWQAAQTDWQQRTKSLYEAMASANAEAERAFPDWSASVWRNWRPPETFVNAAKFARLNVNLKHVSENLPQDTRLALPGSVEFSMPLVLNYPGQGAVLFETSKSGEAAIASINNIIFRLLAGSPPGKANFTIIDPIKLGQNFAAVMHLADFEDNIINGRIWTQPVQIEERLGELNEHMEKVIQMYLRNEYETIAEYNVDAGNIAEKYHYVVIADFPANFTETAVKRLLRIAASGARCGVYTLIHWDHRHAEPPGLLAEELRKTSVCIESNGHLELTHPPAPRAKVVLDSPPGTDLATEFLRKVGEASRGSNRVEVPFTQVAPAENQLWSLETTDELRVPLGRSGATKLQYLAIGKGTKQHALIAGKTGSGKSTLFHVMITNLALWSSPEQVEFYLVDFKKGVEFKGYAVNRLPHARVVAIESDREFGLSVLQRVDEELRRRGDLFRKLGVQDLAGYKRAGGNEVLPRSLLIIDEFQEFFVEDDRISQAANVLLDRIVRQGRAFGIHVLLGSQTLGGAYTLARTTIGQMVIRIALQCNEADAYLIMDENNSAPRLLSRPGEGIYNDMAGAVEGNSPFQVVWLSDEERDEWLRRVRKLADANNGKHLGPIVFEGNAPADVRDNEVLRSALTAPPAERPPTARMWLGAPNSIKGPTEAAFTTRSGNNLLMVGQRDEAVLAMMGVGLVSLAAQFPAGTAKFIILDSAASGSPERQLLERVVRVVPHEVTLGSAADLPRMLSKMAEEVEKRSDSPESNAPEIFLIIRGIQNFRKLRQDDDFGFSAGDGESGNSAGQFQKIITEGPSHGMHVIVSVDTFNNVNRFLGRKALSEFEMRVLFQMSANDSASLCDDPKASTLGLHRALFYNEQEGYLETFRPYALPTSDWLEEAGAKLKKPS